MSLYYFFFLSGHFLSKYFDIIYEYKWAIIFCQVIMSLQLLLFFNFESISLNYSIKENRGYIHLFLGSSYAIWSVFTIMVFEKRNKVLAFLIFLPFLFSIGSRASFYFYIFILPILFIELKNREIKILVIGLTIILIIFIILMQFTETKNLRMFSVFSRSDTSRTFRREIVDANLPQLFANWFNGNYGGFTKNAYPANIYLHNLLGYWSQFGLIPFILLIIILIKSVINSFIALHESISPYSLLLCSLLVFTIATIVLARGHDYPELFLVMGIALNYKQ